MCAGIVQKGWAGMDPENVPKDIIFIGSAPHDKLFPLCSVVVHHGGAGTTAAGLRAGRPTVIVPFFGMCAVRVTGSAGVCVGVCDVCMLSGDTV